MSYPSIVHLCQERGIQDIRAIPEEVRHDLLWDAFHTDLPLGVAYLEDVAAQVRTTGGRVRKIEDPNSRLGKQIARLLGADVARRICSQKLGVAFAFYNCCVTIAAPDPQGLDINAIEQIELQNGVLASADC
ncbi:MAG TPA: hypothetical protein VF974_05200 [Patescibacteria group bacterium]